MTNKELIEKVYEFYVGDISSDDLKCCYEKWNKKHNHKKLKQIRFLVDMAYNCSGDVVTVLEEDNNNLYYNDSVRRWCYIEKNLENKEWEYI